MFEEIIRRLNELEQKEFYLLVQNPLTAYCKTFSFFFFFFNENIHCCENWCKLIWIFSHFFTILFLFVLIRMQFLFIKIKLTGTFMRFQRKKKKKWNKEYWCVFVVVFNDEISHKLTFNVTNVAEKTSWKYEIAANHADTQTHWVK